MLGSKYSYSNGFINKDEKIEKLPLNTEDELPMCSGRLGEIGEWVYAPEMIPSPLKYDVWGECIKTSRFSCNKRYHRFGVTDKAGLEIRMTEANKWIWKPSHCSYVEFDPESFIRKMNGKTLLFIGDSLTETAFESLGCQLWQHVVEKINLREKFPPPYTDLCNEFSKNLTAEAQAHPVIDETFFAVASTGKIGLQCGSGWGHYMYAKLDDGSWVKAMMISSPFLGAAAAYVDRMTEGGNVRLETWWGYILNQSLKPDTIIMNVGVHFSFSRTTFDSVFEMGELARRTQVVLSKVFKGTVIWRSLFQPINECINVKLPLKDYSEYYSHPEFTKFNWDKFEVYNRIWLDAWADSILPLHLLDIRPFTLFPLGHRDMKQDCVHSCLPGPFDRWAADWLWTILLALT